MAGFPEIVRRLPEAEASLRGITLRLLQGPTACVTFVEAMQDSEVPEHAHGAQWGIVVAGELLLTIGGKTRVLAPGEEYFVPAGVPHSAKLKAGVRVIDFFDDPNRYRARKS
ncbi:MAG TPA: cupin domain-containing protein [Thermoplasmata archaeon]